MERAKTGYRIAFYPVPRFRRRNDTAKIQSVKGPQVTSGPDGVVEFALTLSATGQYRLVEVIPPPGFAPTFGYWIIETTTSGGVTTVTDVHPHGGNPPFRPYDDEDGDEWWWVGNRPAFELPLTGGIGGGQNVMLYSILGLGVITAGAAAIFTVKAKRGKYLYK